MNPESNAPAPITPEAAPIAPIKIGRFKASRMIAQESWAILKQDKELAWFPACSAITSLIALAIMGAIFFYVAMAGNIHAFDNVKRDGIDAVSYIILFIYYLVMFIITNYFLAGMYIIIDGRFKGQNVTFSEGIKGANDNMGKIFVWSLISATVGVVLRIIADRSQIVGKIVAALFGAAWNILTYFSLPSLIIGQTSVKQSFKESASIIRKTWGETIIINFSMGLFFGLLFFLGIVIAVGFIVIVPVLSVALIVMVLLVIYFIALSLISATLGSIFKLALYQYARTGTIPQGFTPALIQGAVRAGK